VAAKLRGAKDAGEGFHVFRSAAHRAGEPHRHGAVVINREGAHGQANLLEVVGATDAERPRFRARKRGQQESRQNGDDGNYD